MKITYGIIEETYALGESKRTWYGIAGYADAEVAGTAAIAVACHDVTEDVRSLQALVSLCNRHALSPLHLSEVVEDFLAASEPLTTDKIKRQNK